jgi:hypothetical protein
MTSWLDSDEPFPGVTHSAKASGEKVSGNSADMRSNSGPSGDPVGEK